MADNTDVDPDALRTVGDACYGKAEDCRKTAEPNPGFDLSGFGNGAHTFTSWANDYVTNHRVAGWRGVGEKYQGMGDTHHMNAPDFEDIDATGGDQAAQIGVEF